MAERTTQLAIIGAGIPTGLSTIGAGIAVGPIGAASLAALPVAAGAHAGVEAGGVGGHDLLGGRVEGLGEDEGDAGVGHGGSLCGSAQSGRSSLAVDDAQARDVGGQRLEARSRDVVARPGQVVSLSECASD